MNTHNKISPKQKIICNMVKKSNQEVDYFIAGPEKEADKAVSVK